MNRPPSRSAPKPRHPSTDGPGGGLVNVVGGIIALTVLLSAPTAVAQEPVRLLVLGDSLAAGYGLPPEQAFTAQLEAALAASGHEVTVLEGGVSGDTSAGARARLDWALADSPNAVLLEIGSNDALRGIDPEETEANLRAILDRLEEERLPVLIAGMLAPRNMGPEYTAAFDGLYPELSEDYDVPLYPFFLDGVALDPSLNQSDGIHPNADGVAVIVDRILPAVIEIVETASEETTTWNTGRSAPPTSPSRPSASAP